MGEREALKPPELLERDGELAAIDAALASARMGDGSLVLVEAHAGLGKTGLLAVAGERARAAGMRPLAGRGSALEREHSFGAALQLLEPPLAKASPARRRDLLAGAAGLAGPLLDGRGDALAGPSPDEQLFGLLHALHWVTANLAEHDPLLLALDDAHWADRVSLRFLLYLAQRIDELPVAVVVSARPAEPEAPADLLRELKSHGSARVLRPAPLSLAATRTLVERRMPGAEQPFADACAAATGGNPYLLTELLADLADRDVEPRAANAGEVGRLAPDSVLEATLARLGRLPEGSRALARAVAVLGDDAQVRHAIELAGLDPEAAATALDALVGAELLAHGEPVRFVHPLLLAAIHSDTPAAQRSRAHLRAARLLHRDDASEETVAAHLLSAGAAGDAWVIERLRAAARRSLAQGAADAAARYLERALAEGPAPDARSELLVELGEAEALAGREESVEHLERALALIDDPRRRADVCRRLGWTLQKRGDMPGAVDAFARGLAELGSIPDGELAERLDVAMLQAGHLGASLLSPEHARQAHGRVAALLERPPAELTLAERGVLTVPALHLLFAGRERDHLIDLLERAWNDGQLLEEAGSDAPTVWHVAGTLSWADEVDRAEEVIEAALEAAAREGSIVTRALGMYSRSWTRYWRGDLAGAAADAQAAVDAWSGEFTMYLPVAAHWLALAQLELGEVDAAAHAVDFPAAEERWGQTNMYGPLMMARGAVAMARGRYPEAIELLERAGENVLASSVTNPAVLPWRAYLASARLAAGDREGALRVAREELELARAFGAPRGIGVSLRAAGLAEGGARGTELLLESVTELRGSTARLDLARSLVEAGAALRRDGRRVEARAPLGEGLELARGFGARPLEQRALAELRAAGARPRRRELSGVASLTPSELRVAELAAAGMTNREIAQALFVTVKAVQFHLRNVYRKLEAGGREDLPSLLAGPR